MKGGEMEINADFSRRTLVHAAREPWRPSPMPGVERRMLDRIGGEVARATTIVRYAPDSRFAPHTHEGGEEFLVLEGVFQDEHGDYPAGTYVRNPPGSRHAPRSADGCTIFVKLRQFNPSDLAAVRLETRDAVYAPAGPGIQTLPLFESPHEQVRMEHWPPGTVRRQPVAAGLELLVVAGSLREGSDNLGLHGWLRLPPGDRLNAVAGPEGVRLWVKQGHLLPAPADQKQNQEPIGHAQSRILNIRDRAPLDGRVSRSFRA